ncbi:hypothetical protein B5P44_15630 [Mycobacterium sp. CBMA 213]|nr:hypothetical protein [Mycolicibacterium sp. CBMA 213]
MTGTFKALISDSSDAGGEVDTQNISAFIYFKPSTVQVASALDSTIYRLQTIRARMNASDGQVKNVDGTTLSLVANSAAMDLDHLYYTVSFDHVVYDGKQDMVLDPFTFEAPTDSTPVDLATVQRIQL